MGFKLKINVLKCMVFGWYCYEPSLSSTDEKLLTCGCIASGVKIGVLGSLYFSAPNIKAST